MEKYLPVISLGSSLPYSQLEWEERPPISDRQTSIQFIPNGGIKRILLFLALVIGTTIMIFYRRYPVYQNDIGFRFVSSTSEHDYEDLSQKSYDSIKPEWTWTCQDNRCERSLTSDNSVIQSLETCNFECLATSLEPEPTNEININSMTDPSNTSRHFKPHWTWTCKDGRCERYQSTNNSTMQSLRTCQMLCLTTPLWPEPNTEPLIERKITLLNGTSFTLEIVKSPSNEVTDHIKGAFELLKQDVKKIDKSVEIKSNAKNIKVEVKVNQDKNPRLLLSTSEVYKININTIGDDIIVLAEGESFAGARHALETLTQLIWFDTTLKSLVTYESANVQDAPKFIYRALHLDTARNFFPVEDIIRNIDAMAATKLNTFHWHATDSQSFPLKLNSAPQLALYGAYSRREVYTVDDVKKIVNHARLRGIRVVIEIDAPSHVGRGWTWGQEAKLGDLAFCVEENPWEGTCGEPPCGQLNPENNNVHTILEKIYKEIMELTGVHDIFHLGGDEVNSLCWSKNLKTSDTKKLWFDFTQKMLQSLVRANDGRMPVMTIIWSSGLTQDRYLNSLKNLTIQLWGGSDWPDILAIPDAGIKSIISHVDGWYLDCGFGGWRDASDGNCGYRSWKDVYRHRPWKSKLQKWHIPGGTACMWSEQLGPEGLDSRVWPRAAAFAERLWSDPEHALTDDVYIRLDLHTQRLVDRGIRSDPIWSQWCSNNPYQCRGL